MSPALITRFACGHEERSSTQIGTERGPGLGGIIRKLSCKRPEFVTADSAQLCSKCRKDPTPIPVVLKRGNSTKSHKSSRRIVREEARENHPHPLKSHPSTRESESQSLEEHEASPYTNEFAEIAKYGAHDFTRKHPDDVIEIPHNREAIRTQLSPKFTRQPSKLGGMVRAIEKMTKE